MRPNPIISIVKVITVASLLSGCAGSRPDLVVNDRSIAIYVEEKTNAKYERVFDVTATQRLPLFAELDQDMEDNLIAAGLQTSQRICEGASELTYKTIPRMSARTLLMRFRCTGTGAG